MWLYVIRFFQNIKSNKFEVNVLLNSAYKFTMDCDEQKLQLPNRIDIQINKIKLLDKIKDVNIFQYKNFRITKEETEYIDKDTKMLYAVFDKLLIK